MAGFKLRSKYKAHGFWISPVCPLSSLVQSVRCWNTCQHALTPTSIQSFHFSANLPWTPVTCLSCIPLLANGSHWSRHICTWPCPLSQQIGSCGFLVQVGQWVVILGAGKSSIKVSAGWVLVWALLLACRQLPSRCVLWGETKQALWCLFS